MDFNELENHPRNSIQDELDINLINQFDMGTPMTQIDNIVSNSNQPIPFAGDVDIENLLDENMYEHNLRQNLECLQKPTTFTTRGEAEKSLNQLRNKNNFLETMFQIIRQSDGDLLDNTIIYLEKSIKIKCAIHDSMMYDEYLYIIKEVLQLLSCDSLPIRSMKILSKILYDVLSTGHWVNIVKDISSDMKVYMQCDDQGKIRAICFLYRKLILSCTTSSEIIEFFYETFEDMLNLYDRIIVKISEFIKPHQELLQVVKNNKAATENIQLPNQLESLLQVLIIFQKAVLQYFKKGQIRQNVAIIQFLAQNQRFLSLLVQIDTLRGQTSDFLIEWDGFGHYVTQANQKSYQGLFHKCIKLRFSILICLMTIRKQNKLQISEYPLQIECVTRIMKNSMQSFFKIFEICQGELFKETYTISHKKMSLVSYTNTFITYLKLIVDEKELYILINDYILNIFIEVHFNTHMIRKADQTLFKKDPSEFIEFYNDVVGDHSAQNLKNKTMDLIETIANKTEFGMSMIFMLCLRMLNNCLGLNLPENIQHTIDFGVPDNFLKLTCNPEHALSVSNAAFLTLASLSVYIPKRPDLKLKLEKILSEILSRLNDDSEELLKERVILLYSTYIPDLFVEEKSQEDFRKIIELIVNSISKPDNSGDKDNEEGSAVFLQGCQTLKEVLSICKQSPNSFRGKQIQSIVPNVLQALAEPLKWTKSPKFFEVLIKFINFGSKILSTGQFDKQTFVQFYLNLIQRLKESMIEYVNMCNQGYCQKSDFTVFDNLLNMIKTLSNIKTMVINCDQAYEAIMDLLLQLFKEMKNIQSDWNEDIFQIFSNHFLLTQKFSESHLRLINLIGDGYFNNKNFRMNFEMTRLINYYAFYGWMLFSENRQFVDKFLRICENGSKCVGQRMDDEITMGILYSQLCFQTIIQNFHEFLLQKDYQDILVNCLELLNFQKINKQIRNSAIITIFNMLIYSPMLVLPMLEQRSSLEDLQHIIEHKSKFHTEYDIKVITLGLVNILRRYTSMDLQLNIAKTQQQQQLNYIENLSKKTILESTLFNIIRQLNIQQVNSQSVYKVLDKDSISIHDQNTLVMIETERAKRKKQLKIDGKNINRNMTTDAFNIQQLSDDDQDQDDEEDDEFGFGGYKHYRKGSDSYDDDDEFDFENDHYGRPNSSHDGNYIMTRLNEKFYANTISRIKTELNGKDEYLVLTKFLKDFKSSRPDFYNELMNLLPANINAMAVKLVGIRRIDVGVEEEGSGMGGDVGMLCHNELGDLMLENDACDKKTVPRKILKIKGKKRGEENVN